MPMNDQVDCSGNILFYKQFESNVASVLSITQIPCVPSLSLSHTPYSFTIRERIALLSHIPQRTVFREKVAVLWLLRIYVEVL
jgi:hypothetical protein